MPNAGIILSSLSTARTFHLSPSFIAGTVDTFALGASGILCVLYNLSDSLCLRVDGSGTRADMPTQFASLLRSSLAYTRMRKYSALAQKTERAVQQEPVPIPHEQLISGRFDPFSLISPELNHLRSCLISLLGSTHPGLSEIAEYYFFDSKKQLRASVALLVAKATNGSGQGWHKKQWAATREASSNLGEQLNQPLQAPDVLYEPNPNMTDDAASFSDVFRLRRPNAHQSFPSCSPPPSPLDFSVPSNVFPPSLLLPTQMRLAQIAEMIHVASLLHDHISPSTAADTASQDGLSSKLAILGGDFLLGRASTALSQLGESEVVELIASVISNQVEGEILRMDEVQTPKSGLMRGPSSLEEAWDVYLKQSYFKTACLVAKSARGAVVLGGSHNGEIWKDVAYAYGRNIGIAHKVSFIQNSRSHSWTQPSFS